MNAMQRAVILFAHGSRDPQWSQPLQAIAERLGHQHPELAVACAYLELMQPGLEQAAAGLIASGAQHITVVPMFLGVGRHARQDLPLLVQSLVTQYPGVQFILRPAVGEDPRVIELLATIAAD